MNKEQGLTARPRSRVESKECSNLGSGKSTAWPSPCGSSFCPVLTNSRDSDQRWTSTCLKSLLTPPELTVPDLTHRPGLSLPLKVWHQLGVRGYSVVNQARMGVFCLICTLPMSLDHPKRTSTGTLFVLTLSSSSLSSEKVTVITVQF